LTTVTTSPYHNRKEQKRQDTFCEIIVNFYISSSAQKSRKQGLAATNFLFAGRARFLLPREKRLPRQGQAL
jgi:hypothetical protein